MIISKRVTPASQEMITCVRVHSAVTKQTLRCGAA